MNYPCDAPYPHISCNCLASIPHFQLFPTLQGAAAGLEAIATIQAIRTGEVHPTLNQDDLIDEVDGLDTVPNVKASHKVIAGLSNSFGFGGHNSSVVFAKFEP